MAVISGNDVFSHVFIGAADTSVSASFYDAALGALAGVNATKDYVQGRMIVTARLRAATEALGAARGIAAFGQG